VFLIIVTVLSNVSLCGILIYILIRFYSKRWPLLWVMGEFAGGWDSSVRTPCRKEGKAGGGETSQELGFWANRWVPRTRNWWEGVDRVSHVSM
jgi:hypothetical protein